MVSAGIGIIYTRMGWKFLTAIQRSSKRGFGRSVNEKSYDSLTLAHLESLLDTSATYPTTATYLSVAILGVVMIFDHLLLAYTVAKQSPSRYRLGAVVAKRNRVLGVGFNNQGKTHPIMRKYDPGEFRPGGIHAEVKACQGASYRELNGAEIYVARVLRSGEPALAKPCEICQRFLRAMGVRLAYYSLPDGKAGTLVLN